MEYVVDPNDPKVSLNNPSIIEHLDKGLIIYTPEKITSPNYTYLNIGIEKDVDTTAMATILQVLIEKKLNTPIKYVEVIEREGIRSFIPYTTFGYPVFTNSIPDIDLEELIGYEYFSDSLLSRYLLSDVKYVDDIALVPIGSNIDDTKLISLIQQGYFGYKFGVHDLEDLEIVRELCLLFDIHIIDSKDLSTLICRTDVDFRISPETWIRQNLPLIKVGLFPTFTFEFDFSFHNDYIRLYGSSFRDVILEYVSYLAYAKLSDEHPIIKPFITDIHINDDFSITVSIPSYSLAKSLKNIIEEYLRNGISYNSSRTEFENPKLSGVWNIEYCKDFNEGIMKRWYVQQIDNDAYPMLIKDKSGNEVLIHRSPLGIEFPSPFSNGKDLLPEMKKFYSKCHDNIEPVLLERISDMTLEELLTLIPVEENGKTFCFTNETIENLVNKENPLTRRPLAEKTLLTKKYLNMGLRGLFDVGVLYGLYPEVPTKTNFPIEIGLVKMTREPIEYPDLYGQIFLVEIIFEDGTTSPLFRISFPMIEPERIKIARENINRLWYQGFFLTSWTASIVKYSSVGSFATIINDPILLHAADSIFDGNIAYEYLNI